MVTKYTINYALDDDVDDIASLEADIFPVAWSSQDLAKTVNNRKDLSVCCRYKGKLVGYLLVHKDRRILNLLNAGTHPAYRRKGIQRALLNWLLRRVGTRCGTVSALVDERRIDACNWLKALGFKALHTVPNSFGDNKDDGIYFEKRLIHQ